MKRKTLLFLSMALASGNTLAVDTETRTLTPRVTIFGASSDAIKIQAKNTTFRVPYSVDNQAFVPLDVPFDVVSVSGTSLNYRLTLPFQSATCRYEGKERVVDNPNISLDGKLWPKDGVMFSGALNNHVMRLTYPVIAQKNAPQDCYGVIGVRVEVATL